MMRFLKFMAVFALVTGAVALGPATPAQAELVTFTTTGAFNGNPASPGGSPVTLTAGTATVKFTGDTATVDTPSNALFGTFDTAGTGSSLQSLNGNTFTLYITETVPSPTGGNPATFDASLTGKIMATQSNASVQFSTIQGTIPTALANVIYSILNADNGTAGNVHLNAPSSGSSTSTINGYVSTTPEPSSVVLAGLGALGLVGYGLRRRKAMGA